ncbi:DUF4388 domain-containing protein [Deinococcus maricopensis]|uniref:PatA-like N-terminal domain-containing protein n=1 Tax=Deinococcus maricopensis (strain DSM 21211 / LMG 22137 / NRRL B-23946 / LB-34) TaxID=709986 RepID=E8U6Y9_DEIML|nr:DUF4388 domain-containing protein [Deinococcus maricopensis]ADV66828.1 hypothetical protein Deima_1176 [Deinococcus maricopensis DSM 21211]
MTPSLNLETFDVLELLFMLAHHGRTGALRVDLPDGDAFWAYLEEGQLRHVERGAQSGGAALTALLADPRGQFQFLEGVTHPHPTLQTPVEAFVMEALRDLPAPDLRFDGVARLTAPDRVNAMALSLHERDVLRDIDAARPVGELIADPVARALLGRLARLGLLVPRRTRLARLLIGVTRSVEGVALIDEVILRRWREDVARHVARIEARRDDGTVLNFPVQGSTTAGTGLLLPPDLMLRHDLRAGEAVLVRPF